MHDNCSVVVVCRLQPKKDSTPGGGCVCVCVGGGGVYSDFSYIRRLGSFLGVQNFEFHYFLGFSEK